MVLFVNNPFRPQFVILKHQRPILEEASRLQWLLLSTWKTYRTALAVLSRWGVKLSTLNQFGWVANYDNHDTYVDVVRDAWYCYRGGTDKDGAMFEEEGCSVGRWAGQDTVRQWGGLVENRGSVSELRTGPTPLHANQLSTTNTTLPGVTSLLGPRSSISIQNQSKPPVSFIPKLRVAQYVKPDLWERFFEDY